MSKEYIILLNLFIFSFSCGGDKKEDAGHSKDKVLSKVSSVYSNKAPSNKKIWEHKKVPFGKSGYVVAFGNADEVAIVGEKVILLSLDSGKTWRSLKGGKGYIVSSMDGGKTFKKSYPNLYYPKLSKDKRFVDVQSLCPAEEAVFASPGRLYIFSICDHSTQIWSVPVTSKFEAWYIVGFTPTVFENSFYAPTPDDPSLKDKLDIPYIPYRNLVSNGKRVIVDALLEKRAALLATNDNGKTWTKLWQHWQQEKGERIVDIEFIGQEGWMLFRDRRILKTKNGGRDWEEFSSVLSKANVVSINFASSRVGFAVGEGGLILRSSDGGKSWQKQASNTKSFLYNVVSDDENTVWAVGENGTVLETTDGGVNWEHSNVGWERSAVDTDSMHEQGYFRNIAIKHLSNIAVKNGRAWIIIDKTIYISP